MSKRSTHLRMAFHPQDLVDYYTTLITEGETLTPNEDRHFRECERMVLHFRSPQEIGGPTHD